MRVAFASALCLIIYGTAALAGDPAFDLWRAKQRAWEAQKRADELELEKARIRAAAQIEAARIQAEATRTAYPDTILVQPGDVWPVFPYWRGPHIIPRHSVPSRAGHLRR